MTALYVRTDDLLKAVLNGAPWRSRLLGSTSKISDAELPSASLPMAQAPPLTPPPRQGGQDKEAGKAWFRARMPSAIRAGVSPVLTAARGEQPSHSAQSG